MQERNTPSYAGAAHTALLPWVTEKFIAAAPQVAAQALAGLATHEALALLKPLKAERIISCLNLMPADKAAAVLRRLPSRQAAHILSRLDIKQAGLLYQALSTPQREKMNTLLDKSFVQALQHSQDWPAGSVGTQLTRDFLSFKTETPISEMIGKLKTLPRKKLPVACLVLSKDGKAKGFIRTAELAFYPVNSLAGSIMTDVKSLIATQEVAQAQMLIEQGQPLVPVTDAQGMVLGVITQQEVSAAAPAAKKKRFSWF